MGAVERGPWYELLEVAECARRAGRLTVARQGFMDAAVAADEAGDASALVTAALGVGGLWVHEQRDVISRASVQALWQRAGRMVPSDSLEHARLEVRRAAEAVYEGSSPDRVMAALAHVQTFGDDRATAEALCLLHHVRLGPRHAEERLRLADDIIRLSAHGADRLLALMGLCWRTVDLFLVGDPRANQSLSELREHCRQERCDAVGFIADVLESMVLARAGRLGDAEKAAAAALERGVAAGDPDAPAYYGAMLSALRWWQGRAGEIVDVVRTLAVSPQLGLNDHVYVAADALLSAIDGDEDAAEEALARLGSIGLANLPDSSSWLTTQLLVVEAAYVLGDGTTAREAGELLRPYSTLPVMPSLAVVCLGSAQRGLGLAAATLGEFDQAVEHLSGALRADRCFGSRPAAALTEHSLAAALAARGLPGDDTKAERMASRAEAHASRMGMKLPMHPSWLPGGQARTRRRIRHACLERLSSGWKVGVDGRTALVPDRVGLVYVAQLLSCPGKDIDVLVLASPLDTKTELVEATLLDDAALRNYRRRARELTTIIERDDLPPAKVDEYRKEVASLTEHIRSATGLGGRPRAFPNDHERARTAVRKALLRAYDSIGSVEPELADHLRQSVTTGALCRYAPDLAWSITVRP